jgi:endonuclease YncB( thermonuclease family)
VIAALVGAALAAWRGNNGGSSDVADESANPKHPATAAEHAPLPPGVAAQAALPDVAFAADPFDAPVAEERLHDWSDRSGTRQLRAKLTVIDSERVMLVRDDGQQLEVPVADLSEQDRKYVADHVPVGTVVGKVVGISDGDSVTLLGPQNLQFRVRLVEIDAPELGQDFGRRAREALSTMAIQKEVRAEIRARDRFGRALADLYLDGRHINEQMLRDGFAWHSPRTMSRQQLAAAEADARQARRGLWQDAQPTPPWQFRGQQRRRSQ